MLSIENLKLSYGALTVLNGFTMTLNDGEVAGIIGGSGSGKSTLLKCINKLMVPDSGSIYFDDINITDPETDTDEVRKRIGMVFQQASLFEHLSVIENVMSGMIHVKNMDPEQAYEKAMELLRLVEVSDKAYYYPDALSGGQKQRVAMARTLSMDPELILMDEPTSQLDPIMRGEVEAVIRIVASTGKSVLLVSHELETIRSICSRVLYLRDGINFEEGTPEKLLDNPDREETRIFVRALKLMEFNVESKDFDFLSFYTSLSEFTFRTGVRQDLAMRLSAILEEFFQMVIIIPKQENKINLVIEYDKKSLTISGTIRFSGTELDPDDPIYFF